MKLIPKEVIGRGVAYVRAVVEKKILFVASSHLFFCNLQTFYKIRSWKKLNAFIETQEVAELISIFIVNKPCSFFSNSQAAFQCLVPPKNN